MVMGVGYSDGSYWVSIKCRLCGELFKVNSAMNADALCSKYCRECKSKIEEKNKHESEHNKVNNKMNIKDAITALYEGKKVRSLPSHNEHVLRDGMIDFVDEGLKEKWEPNISSDELDCKWEIIEDE